MSAAQNGHLKGLIGPEENLGEKAWRTYLKPAFSRSHRNINKYTFLSPFFCLFFSHNKSGKIQRTKIRV